VTQLKLYFLGPPRIELDGQVSEPDTRKAIALLAYLTLLGERQSRDTLAAYLWPEFDDSRARAALRRTLSALKTTIGDTPLSATREHIAVEMEHLWCDVLAFRESIASANSHHHPADIPCKECLAELEMAVSLYRDEFMSGFSLRDSVLFDDWQLQQAEDLRRDLEGALEQLVLIAISRHDFDSGIEYARRWKQIDPLREEAHCQLMRLYCWSGKRSAALLQFRECVRILDEELGVSPLPETTVLYQDIQHDSLPLPRLDQPKEDQAEPAAGTTVQINGVDTISVASVPLIGRDSELARMRHIYQQAEPDGRLLIVEGEPGIGKSRLAEALLTWASTEGATTLRARCYEGETNLAYAPIIQIMQDGLDQVDGARLDDISKRHLAEAARLLPQLAENLDLPALPTVSAPGEQVRFYEGITQLLTVLLGGDKPGILFLDDVHWLDSASQELLLYFLNRWQNRPFLILLCWQAEELPPDMPLLPLAADLRRSGVCETIHLTRFNAIQVDALLTSTGRKYIPNLSARLFEETEGLPYFVVEYLSALEQQNTAVITGDSLSTPSSVRDLLHNRLMRISETERQVLQAASVIGHSFNQELVQSASGRSVEETVTALERLSSRGLMVEQSTVFDFSHHKLRALVYDEMGLARRRLLHRRIAETMAERRAMPTATVSAQIANHFQQASLDTDAASYFVQAGDQARAVYAHQDAAHYYQAALALGASEAWKLHAACGELYTRLGDYATALTSYDIAAALAPASDLGKVEHKQAQVYQRQGNWSEAGLLLSQAQDHLGESADPAFLAQLAIDRSLVAHRQHQVEEAEMLAQQARILAETAADQPTLAFAYNLLGLLARNRSDSAEAGTWLKQSRELADACDRLDIQIAARNNLALAQAEEGELDAARLNLEQALTLCQRLGDRHHEAALRSNLADVLHQTGDETAAQEQILQSVTIYADIGREENRWFAEIWQLIEW